MGKLKKIVYVLKDGNTNEFDIGGFHYSGQFLTGHMLAEIARGLPGLVSIAYQFDDGSKTSLKDKQLKEYLTRECNKCGKPLPETPGIIPASEVEIEKAEKNYGEEIAHKMRHAGKL